MATSEGNFQRMARAYLEAINKYNGKTNAILTKLEELAMEQAARADEAEQRGEWLGLLHGVCITLKDCLHVAGYRTTYGSALYAEQISKSDSAVIARLRQAGAIFLAKSNLTEFCYGATGENPAYGDINNPWSLDRVPGGSSSGAAAAAATDVCRLAIGSDTGGSVRIPAALCGVVGLRPTFGRVSNANALGLTVDFDTIGPLARSVSDVARAFAAIAGYDPDDPASIATPVENFLPTLRDGIAGVRIGLPKRYFFENLQPEIERAVLAVATTLERAGARLIDMVVPSAEQAQTNIHICMARADMADIHRDEMECRPDAIGLQVLRRLRLGLDVSGRDYAAARRWLAQWRRDLREMFKDVDLLLTPTTPIVAPLREASADMVETTQALARFTVGIGCAGLPALTLPCGFGEAGMPIGAQLVAKWLDEALLFRAGCASQERTEFHLARPPLVAHG